MRENKIILLQASVLHLEQGIPLHPGNFKACLGAFILFFVKYSLLHELKSSKAIS